MRQTDESDHETASFLELLQIQDLVSIRKPYNGTRFTMVLFVIGMLLSANNVIMSTLSATVSSVLIETKILKLLSSIWLSGDLFSGIISIAMCAIFGVVLERVKGTYQFVVFLISVSLVSELLTLIVFLSMYYFTLEDYYLYTPVCGFSGLIGAFAVATAEIIPQIRVFPSPLHLPFQYYPFLCLVVASLLSLVGLPLLHLSMVLSGEYIAWLYLRYFATNDGGTKGNQSDEFALPMLFPPLLRIPVGLLSNFTYAICDGVGCCQLNESDESQSVGSHHSRRIGLSAQHDTSSINSDRDTELVQLVTQSNPDEAKRREEAKQLIESRLAQLQKEISVRAMSGKSGSGSAL